MASLTRNGEQMKRSMLFVILAVLAISSSAYAQNSSARLGLSWASYDYNEWVLEDANASVTLGTEGPYFFVGTRLDFNRDSTYWNVVQLEFGPRFLRVGPGLILGNPNEKSNQLRANLGATFKPWKGLYFNSRWAPVSINNRSNSNDFLDAGLGWQFNF